MAWTAPRTWVSGELVTAAQFNTHLRDQLIVLRAAGFALSSQAIGDLLQASATDQFARLAAVATGNALISGGVGAASSWGKIALTTHVSGILPLANGGLGAALTDPNADRIPFWDDSAGAIDWLSVGAALALSGTTLTGLGYTITASADSLNPANATTYYFGGRYSRAPQTTADQARLYIQKAGTIKAVYLANYPSGVLGSGESSTPNLRLNNTTDTALTAWTFSNRNNLSDTTGLSIAVVAGDYVEVKFLTPTWVTSPTIVEWHATIYIE